MRVRLELISLGTASVAAQSSGAERKLKQTFSARTVSARALTQGRLFHPSEPHPGKALLFHGIEVLGMAMPMSTAQIDSGLPLFHPTSANIAHNSYWLNQQCIRIVVRL